MNLLEDLNLWDAPDDGYGDLFPARLTARTDGAGYLSGRNVYDWVEQTFDPSTGAMADADPARTGTYSEDGHNPAVELNDAEIAVGGTVGEVFVWMRLRGVVRGEALYEFKHEARTSGGGATPPGAGCGLAQDEETGELSVELEALAGDGLEVADGGTEQECQTLAVATGCGLEIDDEGRVAVDLEALVDPSSALAVVTPGGTDGGTEVGCRKLTIDVPALITDLYGTPVTLNAVTRICLEVTKGTDGVVTDVALTYETTPVPFPEYVEFGTPECEDASEQECCSTFPDEYPWSCFSGLIESLGYLPIKLFIGPGDPDTDCGDQPNPNPLTIPLHWHDVLGQTSMPSYTGGGASGTFVFAGNNMVVRVWHRDGVWYRETENLDYDPLTATCGTIIPGTDYSDPLNENSGWEEGYFTCDPPLVEWCGVANDEFDEFCGDCLAEGVIPCWTISP